MNMRTDHATFEIATRVSIIGFVLQLLASLSVLIFGTYVHDDLTIVSSYYMLLGLPIWLVLFILFYQHKLERLEALEAHQLAEDAQQASAIFEIQDDDLQVAARRLRLMYKYLLPLVSLLVAGGLITIGLWQRTVLQSKLAGVVTGSSTTKTNSFDLRILDHSWAPWGLVLGAAIAVVMFIFSRYIAGMSKQTAWQNLRGGATTAVGTALVGAALAVCHGFQIKDNQVAARILALVLPIYIFLVGLEIAVNFVLNLYTPRRPGEFPRPAFDSRILSLLAAPDSVVKSISDAINYQFGFEVTTTWFYRLLSRQLLPLAGFCLAILIVLNCVSIVLPYEQAIVLSFGKYSRLDENGISHVYNSGPILKWPWEEVSKYPVHLIQKITVGTEVEDPTKPILWGKKHAGEKEDLVIVAPSKSENVYIGDDTDNPVAQNYSVLNLNIPVYFQVKDGKDLNGLPGLINYVNFLGGGSIQKAAYLKEIATRCISRHLASKPIDDVLGVARLSLSNELKQILQTELDNNLTGIRITFVGIAGIHPPMGDENIKVADSFEEVLIAQEVREKTIEEAKSEAIRMLAAVAGSEDKAIQIAQAIDQLDSYNTNSDEYKQQTYQIEKLLLEAGGNAAKTILEAQADRWKIHMDQLASMIRHNSRLIPFRAAPRLYYTREYLHRLALTLKGRRLFIPVLNIDMRLTFDFSDDPTTLNIGAAQKVYDEKTGG